MKLTLLFECFVFVTLISSSISIDWNLHLEDLADRLDVGKSVKNFTWSKVNELLTRGIDTVVNPNLRGIFKIAKKLAISADCREAMTNMVFGLRKGKKWAVEMVDASGKLPSGILEGTVMDFGSMQECLRIKVKTSEKDGAIEQFRGQFCMVGYQSQLLSPMYLKSLEGKSYFEAYGHPPEWAYDVVSRAGGYLKRIAFWFGTCVPSTCTEEDIWKISTVVTKPLGFNVSVTDCQVDKPYVWPSDAVAAVCVLSFLLGVCILGTTLDVICRWRKSNPTSSDDDHVLLRVPKAFSLLTNTEMLFCGTASGGCLSCFHGIRFLSATWIVLGHTYFYTDTWKYLKYRHLLGFEEQFNGYLPIAVLENFTVPVGSFFFMSGFLLVYTTWRQLEKNEGKLNIFMFFIHKYWRMTPALGLTMALFFSLPLVDSGPIWNSTLNPPLQQCRNMWWASFLYINNWWNTDQYCLIHTWYLAALMQFHMLGVILLTIAYRWPRAGVYMGLLSVIACATTTALLVVWKNFPMPAPGLVKDMDIIDDYNSTIYVKPFAHFTTYFIGMIVAYIILKYHDIQLARKYHVLGWTLAVSSAMLSVYGLYGPGEHVAVRAFYIIGHRIGWAAGIGWLTYACATGNGGIVNRLLSWSALAPLGQLSYLTYLIHPLVIIYRNAALRERVFYGHTELVFSFLSTLVFSLFLAFAGYVMVETPFSILEKIIFRNRSKLDVKNMKYREDPSISPCGFKNICP